MTSPLSSAAEPEDFSYLEPQILHELATLRRLALSANRTAGGWVSRTILVDIVSAHGLAPQVAAALAGLLDLGLVESQSYQNGYLWRATAAGLAQDRSAR